MKIIDFDRKGNVVRFYLGADDCNDYWGDDWNDSPYDCNAGPVYDEYIADFRDIAFDFDDVVLEPCNGVLNCYYSKEDMKNRKVPCLIVVPKEVIDDSWDWDNFARWVGADGIQKFYFGDEMSVS